MTKRGNPIQYIVLEVVNALNNYNYNYTNLHVFKLVLQKYHFLLLDEKIKLKQKDNQTHFDPLSQTQKGVIHF